MVNHTAADSPIHPQELAYQTGVILNVFPSSINK